MKHFRRFTLIALFIPWNAKRIPLGLPTLLLVLCFLVNCIGDGWYDDGSMYLCPECKDHPYFQLGDICERCGAGTNVNPLKYCYDCAIELNSCQCCCQNCEVERGGFLLKCHRVKL